MLWVAVAVRGVQISYTVNVIMLIPMEFALTDVFLHLLVLLVVMEKM
jgi:hypothetical protein